MNLSQLHESKIKSLWQTPLNRILKILMIFWCLFFCTYYAYVLYLWQNPLTRSHPMKPHHKHVGTRGQHSVLKLICTCVCIGSGYVIQHWPADERLPAPGVLNSQIMNCTLICCFTFNWNRPPNFILLTAILKYSRSIRSVCWPLAEFQGQLHICSKQ